MISETEIVGDIVTTPPTSPKRRNAGFTLIELLIVIAILGILSIVVVISIGGVRDEGQDQACSADAQALRTAAEAFRSQDAGGAWPATETAMVTANVLNRESVLWAYAPPAGGVTAPGPIGLTPQDTRCTLADL